jgi:hypothetical protein
MLVEAVAARETVRRRVHRSVQLEPPRRAAVVQQRVQARQRWVLTWDAIARPCIRHR